MLASLKAASITTLSRRPTSLPKCLLRRWSRVLPNFAKNARAPVDGSTTAFRRYITYYLSRAHRDNIDHGCPVAGFAGDAPRLGAGAQSHFAGGLDDQMTILAGLIAESGSFATSGERRTLRERAISLHCQMVGALVLSRSVAQVAPALSNEILENVQRDILASLDDRSSQPYSRECRS
jgi:TetR/AcrR family transcriptional repressor of nem operon